MEKIRTTTIIIFTICASANVTEDYSSADGKYSDTVTETSGLHERREDRSFWHKDVMACTDRIHLTEGSLTSGLTFRLDFTLSICFGVASPIDWWPHNSRPTRKYVTPIDRMGTTYVTSRITTLYL